MRVRLFSALWLMVCVTACDRRPVVTFDISQPLPDKFSEMAFFTLEEGEPVYSKRVIPYALNAPLFSDYAMKYRAIYVPEEAQADLVGEEVISFPVGTVLMKSFAFPADFRSPETNITMVETRLLVHYETGWKPYPYIWNGEQTEATLQVEGEVRSISFLDDTGEPREATYLIPQKNQCFECHERKDAEGERFLTPIGTRPRYMNRPIEWKGDAVNQLDLLVEQGVLTGPLQFDASNTATEMGEFFELATPDATQIEHAARDYLDINCAHCHRPDGISGITSQLFLNVENEDLFHLGVCKRPGSAGEGTGGFDFDIVPGDPEHSILYYRVVTEEVGAMMPMIGRSIAHRDGAELVRLWIEGMTPESCD